MRAKRNEAAKAVVQWDALWLKFLQARASGDFKRIERVRREIERFDREHGTQPLRCIRED